MKSIQLKSGKKLNCLSVFGKKMFIRGADRDCLTFNFNADDFSMDSLTETFKNENETNEIIIYPDIIENEANTENETVSLGGCQYSDYCIFVNLEFKDEVIQKEDNEKEEEKIPMISVTMGQLSYSEKLETERIKQLENLSEVFADLLGGAL